MRPATADHVVAGGCSWHVTIAGSGPPLLLLHGTGASHHSWQRLAPFLASDHRLIMPDLPGHGGTEADARHLDLNGMTRAVAALLDQLAIQPAFVIGHSAGAAIALALVRAGAIVPRHVVGLNAALVPFSGFAGIVFAPLARALTFNPWAATFAANRARDPARVAEILEGTGSKLDPEGVAAYQRLFTDPRHVQSALRMMATWDLVPLTRDFAKIVTPVTLIATSGDLAVPPEQAFDVAKQLPNARVVYHRQGGHLAQEEYPEEIATLIRAALEGPAPLTPRP